jgi:hypothetical protein
VLPLTGWQKCTPDVWCLVILRQDLNSSDICPLSLFGGFQKGLRMRPQDSPLLWLMWEVTAHSLKLLLCSGSQSHSQQQPKPGLSPRADWLHSLIDSLLTIIPGHCLCPAACRSCLTSQFCLQYCAISPYLLSSLPFLSRVASTPHAWLFFSAFHIVSHDLLLGNKIS